MEKKTFWQQVRIMDDKMVNGLIIDMGIGLAMGVALGNWGMGIAVGVGIGTALGAGLSQQTKKDHKGK